MLGRAVGGGGPRRGDLFSYLSFDPEFIEASIELGRSSAEAAFEGLPPNRLPWQTGPRQRLTTP
jgi:NTE family protein